MLIMFAFWILRLQSIYQVVKFGNFELHIWVKAVKQHEEEEKKKKKEEEEGRDDVKVPV